jgi:hypothetical protein
VSNRRSPFQVEEGTLRIDISPDYRTKYHDSHPKMHRSSIENDLRNETGICIVVQHIRRNEALKIEGLSTENCGEKQN